MKFPASGTKIEIKISEPGEWIEVNFIFSSKAPPEKHFNFYYHNFFHGIKDVLWNPKKVADVMGAADYSFHSLPSTRHNKKVCELTLYYHRNNCRLDISSTFLLKQQLKEAIVAAKAKHRLTGGVI